MSPWIVASLIAVFALVHMARPRFRQVRISAARFFADLESARKAAPKLALANPVRSRPFYLQLALILVLVAALLPRSCRGGAAEQGLGIWLLVDTSASMQVAHDQGTRMDLARAEANAVLDLVQKQARGQGIFVRLSSFDQERLDLAEGQRLEPIRAALAQLDARPLGTDLELVRQLRRRIAEPPAGEAAVTHLVVISDMPAPDWFAGTGPIVVWRHVGRPAANVGFSHVAALIDPLRGDVRKLRLSVSAWGLPQSDVTVRIEGPKGDEVFREVVHAAVDPLWRTDFTPEEAGLYNLSLEPGGAWSLDDRIQVRVPEAHGLAVDWQVPDQSLLKALGWVHDPEHARLRIAAYPDDTGNIPSLQIGSGYGRAPEPVELSDFIEASPLLADLNLDAVERLNLSGTELSDDFAPVLRNSRGQILLGQRDQRPAVYLPGLPTQGEPNLNNVSTTLFFNSVRTLLGQIEPPPLYQLTQPGQLEVGGTVLAIHPGEGNTARAARSYGALSDLTPVQLAGETEPLWPRLLILLALLFLVERILATWGGPQWR